MTCTTPKRASTWTSRVTALRSRFNLRARRAIESGSSFTSRRSRTRFSVSTCNRDSKSSKASTLLSGIAPPRSARFAIPRPRSKNASVPSTRISLFRTFHLIGNLGPLVLKALLDILKASPFQLSHSAAPVTMRRSMSRIIAQHPAVVSRRDQWIYVCQIVTNHQALFVYPNLPSQHPAARRFRMVQSLVDCLPNIRHDLQYHACSRECGCAERRQCLGGRRNSHLLKPGCRALERRIHCVNVFNTLGGQEIFQRPQPLSSVNRHAIFPGSPPAQDS